MFVLNDWLILICRNKKNTESKICTKQRSADLNHLVSRKGSIVCHPQSNFATNLNPDQHDCWRSMMITHTVQK